MCTHSAHSAHTPGGGLRVQGLGSRPCSSAARLHQVWLKQCFLPQRLLLSDQQPESV